MTHIARDIPSPVDAYEAVFVPSIFDALVRKTVDHIHLQKGGRLMDLACGTGVVARHMAPLLGEEGTIVAVDINPQMLSKARSLAAPAGARVEWREGDATDLDAPDGTFDTVICQQGLQYLSDPAAGVRECRRILADRGQAVFSTWRGLSHVSLFKELVEVEARHLDKLGATYEELAEPFLMDDAEELCNLLETAGFRQVAVTEASIEARFPSAANFAAHVEVAYASVMPHFVENPRAFEAFVENVERDMHEAVERYRDGDGVRFPMKTHITTGRC